MAAVTNADERLSLLESLGILMAQNGRHGESLVQAIDRYPYEPRAAGGAAAARRSGGDPLKREWLSKLGKGGAWLLK